MPLPEPLEEDEAQLQPDLFITSPSDEDVDNHDYLEPKKIVVMPVAFGEISLHVFFWYLDNMHRQCHRLHVCHVPDFKTKLKAPMDPEEVLQVMKTVNSECDNLKDVYESILTNNGVKGRFVRVGGNTVWTAISEYCKLVDPHFVIMGSQVLSGTDSNGSKNDKKMENVNTKMSSVTHDVLLHTHFPIMIIKDPKEIDYRAIMVHNTERKRFRFSFRNLPNSVEMTTATPEADEEGNN